MFKTWFALIALAIEQGENDFKIYLLEDVFDYDDTIIPFLQRK
jgi:hypothetical protein